MTLNGSVDRLLIVNAVSDETVDFPVDLAQQRWHLGWVLLRAFRHRRGNNFPLSIHPDVQFLPAFLLLLAVLLGMSFALTTHL